MHDMLKSRHPYIYAKAEYINGNMHSSVAVALILTDREFCAEMALNPISVPFDNDGPAMARAVIEQSWTRDAVAASCPSGKRPEEG